MAVSVYEDAARLYFVDRAPEGGYRIAVRCWGSSKLRTLPDSGRFDRFGEAQAALDRFAARRELSFCRLCRHSTGAVANPDKTSSGSFSAGCALAVAGALLAFSTEAQAGEYIDGRCTGDSRLQCRAFLREDLRLAGVQFGETDDNEMLLARWERIEDAMPKQTYTCPCGRTFDKSSAADVTGLRLDLEGGDAGCRGCPFIEPVSRWEGGKYREVARECRASRGAVHYTTRARWRPGDATNVHVYTLDLDWLREFIAAWLEAEAPVHEIDRDDPAALERYFCGTGRSGGKRVYSFSFRANRAGVAFKEALFSRFFTRDGTALASRGEQEDKQAVLAQIARRKGENNMLPEMIQRVEPSEGCCPYFGGARPGNGGPLLTCRGKETLISSRESFAAKLPRCTGAPRDCWVYLMQYLKDQGVETRGKSEKELRNMYDGCRLKEGLRAGEKPPEPVDTPPPACPYYRGIKKDPHGRCWQVECAVSLDPHVYGYEQKASAQHNAKRQCLSGAEHPECRYFNAAKEKGDLEAPEQKEDRSMTKQANPRCPLQPECERKCGFAGRELSCDYYNANARPGCEVPDQEEIRRERERRREYELFEKRMRESDDSDNQESGQAELSRPAEMESAETVPAAASEVPAPPRPLADITAEIRFYKAQTVSNILEIGRRLTEAKAQLGHGQWLGWLEKEVEFSERTAQNFMRLAESYPNPQPVADLPYSKMLALLAVPAEEREAFVETRHEVNGEQKTVAEMSRRELEQAIRERDEARRIARVNEEASLAAAAEKARLSHKLDELQGQLNQAQARGESLSGHNRTLTDKIRALESRPVEVAVAEPSAERIAELRQEGYEQARAELAASAQPVILLAQPLLQYNEIAEGAASLLIAAAGQSASGEGDRMLTAGVDTLRRQIERLEEARGRLASAVRTLFPDAGDIDW